MKKEEEQSFNFDIWEEIIFRLKYLNYIIEAWKYRCRRYKGAKKSLRDGFIREFQMGLKEEFLFVTGLFIGVIFGFLGNFFATIYFRWVDGIIDIFTFLPVLIVFIFVMVFFIIWWIKLIMNMKREYYRKVWKSTEWKIIHPWKPPKPPKSKGKAFKIRHEPKPPKRKK